MSTPEPELLARWARAAASAPDAPAVLGSARTLSRGELLRRAHGAAAAGGGRRRVADDDVCTWIPWLAGCALGGGVCELDPAGTRAPPPAADAPPAPAPATRPCLAVRTTGTTGAPRLLLRDRAAWLRCAAAEEALLGLGPGERVLALGAPGFSLTPYAAFRALHLGAAIGVVDRITPRAAGRMLAALAPTLVYGAPPLVAALARLPAAADAAPARIVTGGTRPTRAQLDAMRAAWPRARIATFYGTAEASFVALNPDPDPDDPGDAGPLFPGVEAALDGDGRLSVRTPYAALATEQPDGSRRPLAGTDGWITLADRVTLGDDGRVRVLGRADARIDVGGALLDPAPAERALERLDWVAEAAVIALPDTRRSSRAVAVVVPAGAPPADAQARARRALAAAGPLRARVECLAGEPPRTAGGKLDRRALAARLADGDPAAEAPR